MNHPSHRPTWPLGTADYRGPGVYRLVPLATRPSDPWTGEEILISATSADQLATRLSAAIAEWDGEPNADWREGATLIFESEEISPMNALDTYMQKYAGILDQIERLQDLADDHFGHDPDEIDWAHVGDLGRVETALAELLAVFEHEPNTT